MSDFFFLRPVWLLGVLLSFIGLLLFNKATPPYFGWRDIMDSHIARRLILTDGRNKYLTPVNLLLIMLTVLSVAMAGPSFEKRLPEDMKDKAVVIVLLSNSDSMYAGDITPNRNRAAKMKIEALRAALPKSQFGLIAYDYSAHKITPLTDDASFLRLYLKSIEPKIMPKRELLTTGLQHALELAEPMIETAKYPAHLVIVTDRMNKQDREDIVAFESKHKVAIEVLAVGTQEGGALRFVDKKDVADKVDTALPVEELHELKLHGISITGVTQNNEDVRGLTRKVKESILDTYAQDASVDWKDSGYLLTVILLPLSLMLFRKRVWLLSISPLFLALSSYSPSSYAYSWDELWWTPDQRAQKAFDAGDYAKAAPLYVNPYHKAYAYYVQQDYISAEKYFKQGSSAEALFYAANSMAFQGKFRESLLFYGKAARIKPGFKEALHNSEIVKRKLSEQEKLSGKKDSERIDNYVTQLQQGVQRSNKQKKKPAIDPLRYSEEELNAWLKKVRSSPEKMLKTRFELQSQGRMLDEL